MDKKSTPTHSPSVRRLLIPCTTTRRIFAAMLILLDCRPLQLAGPDSEKTRLIFSLAAELTHSRGWRWLLLADKTRGSLPQLPSPLLAETLLLQRALPGPGRLGWRWWYKMQIPRLARKHKVDIIMLTGGVAAGVTAAPQFLLDKFILTHPFPSPSAPGPLTPAERSAAKAEFAGGKEYFAADISAAGEEGVIHLLKAFSLFKKRQHSNLQLVIRGNKAEALQQRLDTYKYREEVHWCPPSADRGNMTAGAYAALFPVDGDSLGTPVLDAWKAGVPVLLSTGGPLQEMAGDAALYAGAADDAALAANCMAIYKDEELRNRLIARGLSRLSPFDIRRTADAVGSAIDKKS